MRCDVIHDEIKRRLKEVGCSLRDIAEECEASISYVSMVSKGIRSNDMIERAISSKLSTNRRELWLNKYKKRNLSSGQFTERFTNGEIKELLGCGILTDDDTSRKGADE